MGQRGIECEARLESAVALRRVAFEHLGRGGIRAAPAAAPAA